MVKFGLYNSRKQTVEELAHNEAAAYLGGKAPLWSGEHLVVKEGDKWISVK